MAGAYSKGLGQRPGLPRVLKNAWFSGIRPRMQDIQKNLRVLVLGSGGREHALAWRIAQSPRVSALYCAPGNAGMVEVAECIPDLKIERAEHFPKLFAFVEAHAIDLVVVGPEAPLSEGVVDAFERHFQGTPRKIFGPSQGAAKLEWSKVFSKEFCLSHGIPTAKAFVVTSAAQAREKLKDLSFPVVLKVDGLAAGKGVVIAQDQAEFDAGLHQFFAENRFGSAAKQVLLEAFVTGEEASFFAICDGKTAKIFPSCQDHKRIFDQDKGPNTGGMGAYSPAPIVTPVLEKAVVKRVVEPLLAGMAQLGSPYVGVLYVGLMIDTATGAFSVLEFNCRLGDPEAQVLLLRLQTDFIDLALAACEQRLQTFGEVRFDSRPATCVVLAAKGYPEQVQTGDEICGLKANGDFKDAVVFHAGTVLRDHAVYTAGGRVLGVCALGASLKASIAHAYEKVKTLSFQGMQYRKDIGHKGLLREVS